jgi:hypothetical protein
MHLELPSQRGGGRVWAGGDPARFYELYVKEFARVGEPMEDDDGRRVKQALALWKRVGERHIFSFKPQTAPALSSKDILGVELSELAGVFQVRVD